MEMSLVGVLEASASQRANAYWLSLCTARAATGVVRLGDGELSSAWSVCATTPLLLEHPFPGAEVFVPFIRKGRLCDVWLRAGNVTLMPRRGR